MDFQQLLAACSFSAAEIDIDAPASRADSGTAPSQNLEQLTDDSRAVDSGTIFVLTEMGRPFVAAALERGPAVVLADAAEVATLPALRDELAPDAVLAFAADLLAVQGRMAAALHGDPAGRLEVVGITGTNGKTSTAFMLYHIWNRLGIPAGLIGTLGVRWRPATGGNGAALEKEVERQTGYTTPRSGQLHALLAEMLAAGVERVVMEVSSEALALGRLEGTRFARAVFVNLTPEHLDYHGDMDSYFAAKMKLFEMTARDSGELIVYGTAPGGESAVRYARDVLKTEPRVLSEPTVTAEELAMPAFFHRINASLALAGAGLDDADSRRARELLRDLPGVPGRYTVVRPQKSEKSEAGSGAGRSGVERSGLERYGIVDYAHSPDGLDNVLRAARAEGVRRLVCVFGCGGDRDATKRPLMGAIAARHADALIITDDNPRTEDPAAIRAAIRAGVEGVDERPGPAEIQEIGDRRAAIQSGVDWIYKQSETPAVVLVAGKGHESMQIFADRREPFSDREVLAEIIDSAQKKFTEVAS